MLNPRDIRRHILRMAKAGNSGHLGSALSLVEILCALYDRIMQPGDELLIGKGHAAMAQWACRYERGDLTDADLDGYLSDGSKLLGSVETGSALGHALSVGVGVALGQQRKAPIWTWQEYPYQEVRLGEAAMQMMGAAHRTFVIVGDGELNEGACWEAIMAAAQWKLGNLYLIVDRNGYQAMGATQDVMDLSPLRKKFEAFGWSALKCQDGHNVETIAKRLDDLRVTLPPDRPKVLICHTVKGAGVRFMAGDNDWHYNRLTDEQYTAALAEVERDTEHWPA